MTTCIAHYINGEFVPPTSGNYLPNIEPATGKAYGEIPDGDTADVARAVEAAQAAFPAWSTCGVEVRAKYLAAIAKRIEERHEELAQAESRDNGKPVALARMIDIPRAAQNFAFFSTAIHHDAEEAFFTEGRQAINYTRRHPVGVAGCISPWNLPLYLFTWKIAPALAAGCCVVAKPSEVTPYTAFLLSDICREVGLPAGVLNIVHGLGPKVGQAIVEHPNVPALSFTGGTATGAKLAATAAPMFKKLSLELGGKNPNIIFADCDFEEALETTLRSSFANQGQICLCGSRIYVQQEIYTKFRDAFVERVAAMRVGDPTEEEVNLGAVVSEPHLEKIQSYIRLAEEEGGRILTGGAERIRPAGRCAEGYFLRPTVLEGLSENCRVNQEEIFGPVVTLQPFTDEKEALRLANSTPYGLSATLWTQHLNRAHSMAEQLKAGIVWVNCWLLRDLRTPFGGVKQSGVGREGGFHALHFFTEEKNVCVKLTPF